MDTGIDVSKPQRYHPPLTIKNGDSKAVQEQKEDAAPIEDKIQISEKSPENNRTKDAPSEKGNAEHPAHKDLNTARSVLYECVDLLKRVERSLYGTDNEMQDAARSLGFSEFPIRQASLDTKEKDVSHQGYLIDSHLTSTRRNVREGQRKETNADQEVRALKEKLARSYKALKKAREKLKGPGEETANTLTGKSMELVNEVFKYSDNGSHEILGVCQELGDIERTLAYSDFYLMDIKTDRVGKDVSNSGRQLQYLIDRAQWDIRDTERYIRNAESDFHGAGHKLKLALQSVDDAQKAIPSKKNGKKPKKVD